MNWRPYATGIVISAGVFVTGVLWHQRSSQHIAAEDIAALMADAWERDAVMSVFGSDPLTNAFLPHFFGEDSSAQFGKSLGLLQSNTIATARMHTRLRSTLGTLVSHLGRTDGGSGSLYYHYPPLSAGHPHWLTEPWTEPANAIAVTYPASPWIVKPPQSDSLGYVYLQYELAEPLHCTPSFTTLDTRRISAGAGVSVWGLDSINEQEHMPSVYLFSSLSASPTYKPFGDAGNWWTQAGLGTNVYIWPGIESVKREIIYGEKVDSVSYPSLAIRTNTLNKAKTVIDAMTQAILVSSISRGNWDRWQYTSKKTRYGYGYFGPGLEPLHGKAPLNTAIWVAQNRARAFGLDTQTTTGAGLFIPTEPLVYIDAHYGGYADTNDPDVHSVVHVYAGAQLYLGVRCDWPPDEAYAAGLVKRVRYYAVFHGTKLANPIHPWPSMGNLDTYTATSGGTHIYATDTLGGGVALAQYPYFLVPGNTEITIPPWCPHHTWPLTKLADVSWPTSAPRVNIGADDVNVAVPYAMTATGLKTYSSFIRSVALGENHPSLGVLALICVVDFNFTNYSDGGKSEVYIPPWATRIPP